MRFPAVEINSSFYHSHQPATYVRWAAATPEHFKFAVKAPKQVTHVNRLRNTPAFNRFVVEIGALGEKLGPVLVQLPPSLAFEAGTVRTFWQAVRDRFAGDIACEPRHATWFTLEADRLLAEFKVARVAADPALLPAGSRPGGWPGLIYYRLHGSPRLYFSAYTVDRLAALANSLSDAARSTPAWCIFNNTAAGLATVNAFILLEQLQA
jgi:uncharacterized protein YecE (DUF72 family)